MIEDQNLYRLEDQTDYKIASGDPDIRNWKVQDADNRIIGKVDTLLVNIPNKRVVYIDVELDQSILSLNYDAEAKPAEPNTKEYIDKEGDNHIIIPIGMVDLDKGNKIVQAINIDHRTFLEVPRRSRDTLINRNFENEVLKVYNRRQPHTPSTENDEFYERAEFNRDGFSKKPK